MFLYSMKMYGLHINACNMNGRHNACGLQFHSRFKLGQPSHMCCIKTFVKLTNVLIQHMCDGCPSLNPIA